MASSYIAEIILFAGNFAPRNWAFCNGQILSIAQNTALFSLLGTTYGGNGQTTFALPDLRSRVPIHPGQGPGLSSYSLGQVGGVETVTLLSTQIPAHNHSLLGSNAEPTDSLPGNLLLGSSAIYTNGAGGVALNPQSIGLTGGNQPHTNVQPYLALNFIICLFGIFPSRN
jgi:microcystin-dependent protein